jgi:hypothetical protein
MTIRFTLPAFLAAAVTLGSAFWPVDACQKPMEPNLAGQQPQAIATPKKTIGERKALYRKVIVRRAGEDVEALTNRILPPGASTLTKPLEMTFSPLGRVILILFEVSPDAPSSQDGVDSIYTGWLLAPDGKPDSYRLEVLPPISAGFGRLDYDILSVFTADADGDRVPELCVLSEINEIGRGDAGRSMYDTEIFKWSEGAFTLVEQGDKRPLFGLRNAKAVRARLKKILLGHPAGMTTPLR